MAGDIRVQRASKVLEEEIAALQERAAIARRRRPRQPGANGAAGGATQSSQEQASAQETDSTGQGDIEQIKAAEAIDVTVMRLRQIEEWIKADSDMLPFIARMAGNLESKFRRRDLVLNVTLSTIFLIAGWLLSTIATPIAFGHFFGQ